MRRVAAVVMVAVVLLAAPACAWEVKSAAGVQPGLATELRADAAALPTCVRQIIARRLRVVVLVPGAGLLSTMIDATSFRNGVMVLNVHTEPMRTAFLHELGHYYDWGVGISETPEWRAAVAADFRGMSPKLRRETAYLASPREAFAELFAAHFEGDEYYTHDWYHVAAMPHASALLTARLCDAEGRR
jgi:hypothetical protein